MSRFADSLKAALESVSTDPVVDATADVIPEATPEAAPAGEGEPDVTIEISVVTQDDNVVVDTSDSAEESTAEVAAAEQEITDTDEQATELEDAAAGLEAIYDTLRAAGKQRPLSKDTLKFANIAIESYSARLGLGDSLNLSTEGRKDNTISLESLKVTIQRAWEVIKELAIKIWTAIVGFVKRLLSAAERLEHRGRKLVALSGKLGSNAAKSKGIELKGLASKIAIGNEIQSNPATGLNDLIGLAEAAAADSAKCLSAARDYMEVAELTARGDISASESDARLMKAIKGVTDVNKFTSKTLPGNKKLDRKDYTFGKFKHTTLTLQSTGAGPENATMKTMSSGEIRATGEAAVRTAKAIKDINGVATAALKEVKSFKKIQVSADLTKEQEDSMRVAQRGFRTLVSSSGKILSASSSHLLSVGLAYVQIAERSAAQYSAKAPKAEAAKAA